MVGVSVGVMLCTSGLHVRHVVLHSTVQCWCDCSSVRHLAFIDVGILCCVVIGTAFDGVRAFMHGGRFCLAQVCLVWVCGHPLRQRVDSLALCGYERRGCGVGGEADMPTA